MPYISEESKKLYKHIIDRIDLCVIQTIGDLTYLLYKLCLRYIAWHGKRFINLCAVIGSLICCALELYRRIIGPYEDEAIKKNGDVKLKEEENGSIRNKR